jgi:hypothetical protein
MWNKKYMIILVIPGATERVTKGLTIYASRIPNHLKLKNRLFRLKTSPYRVVNTFHLGYNNKKFMV